MLRNPTSALVGLAAAALLVPAAAFAKPGHGHGNPHVAVPTTDVAPTTDAPPAPAAAHGKHLAKGHAKPHKLVLKGTVVSLGSATVTIHVTQANHHGKALVGQDVAFTIPEGGVRAADRNHDGKVDLSDVGVSDKVLVQTTKIAVDAAQPFAARKLVDQTGPEQQKDDEDAAEAPETPETPAPAPTA